MLSEKKKKNLPVWMPILVLHFCFYSCNFGVPKNLEDFGLLLNFQKFAFATAVSEGNITVTGTVKDATGNVISGGILEISRSTNTNLLSKASADTKVYTDTSGKFSMNIYVGSFSIKVSRPDGTLVGSFALKVTNATTTPEVSSATGLQVTGISAAPVGTTTPNTPSTPVAFLSIPNGTPSSLLEGNSSTIGVIMTGSVTQSYTVTITSSNPSAISVNPSSIEVTPTNFSINKQITLTAVQDENLVSENVKITLSSEGLNKLEFTLTTTDDDTQNIVLDGVNSLTQENSGSISVKLTKEPASNTTVNLVSSLPSALTLSTSSLTFTPANYSLPQTVTVNALRDTNQESETVTITASAVGITDSTWNVLCIDDPTIVFTGGSSVTEGGLMTLSITLSGNPGSSRTVNFSSGNTDSITVSPSSMIFTTSTYGSPQVLTVTGVEDANVIAETITITASGSGIVSTSKVVSTIDNDTMTITLGGATTVNEGSTASMTVVLTNDPSGSLIVNLSSGDTAISVSPSTLTFTSANYSTIQNITLTGIEDSNESSETVTITTSATGVTSQTRSVVAIDNDIKPIFTGASSVIEGGTASISITLSGNPGISRTLSLSSNNISSVTLTPVELTFTPANWNSPQTVNLSGVQDLNALGESVTLTAAGTGLVTATKSITVVDDENQNIILASNGSTIDEGTSSVTISVKLAYDPGTPYQVTLASSNPSSVSVSPGTLTFTSANFSTNQIVTLTGVEDANQTSESITITASGMNVSNQTLSYTTIENDTTIVFGTPNGYEGSTVTVPITLSGNPGGSRTVNFSSNTNPPTFSPSSKTFTTSNFSTSQTLTLTGLTDSNTSSVITAQDSNQLSSTKLVTKTWSATTAKYSIGGTVSGLTGNLVLINRGSYDTTTVTANGNFSFSKTASIYAVDAKLYLLQQICLLSNTSGIASAITSIGITCKSSYTIGGGALGLLATGQTTSYETWDDGAYQGTLKRSFMDNGNGTITDNITGLIWQKCSGGQNNDSTCSGSFSVFDWSSAVTYCSSLTLASKTWRLPNVNELQGLVDFGKSSDPFINSIAFPGTGAFVYWTSTLRSGFQDTLAHVVNFSGITRDHTMSKTSQFLYVRCVTGP